MDGTNAAGRKVSLLNDNGPPCQLVRLPSISPSLRSRTSSYNSSPIGSPPTPQLVRSNSSDSTTMHTPSPITPDFSFDSAPLAMDSPEFAQNGFFPSQHQHHHQQKELTSAYPPVPHHTGPLPYHSVHAPSQPTYFSHPSAMEQRSAHHQQQQQQISQQMPQVQQHQPQMQQVQQQQQQQQAQQSAAAAAAAANQRPKKNSYPCPMAKTYGCNDLFTTSGHAARHAKKHTGKKDAFCPECNKAFTRKDNMEQHRRTHQSGRNSAKTAEREVKKAKQSARRPKPAPLQSSTTPSLSALSLVDPTLPISPAGAFLQATDSFAAVFDQQRSSYPDPTGFSMTSNYSAAPPAPSPVAYVGGLDALAMAASGEKRKFES